MKYLYRGFLIGLTCFMIVNYGIGWILLLVLYAFEIDSQNGGNHKNGKSY